MGRGTCTPVRPCAAMRIHRSQSSDAAIVCQPPLSMSASRRNSEYAGMQCMYVTSQGHSEGTIGRYAVARPKVFMSPQANDASGFASNASARKAVPLGNRTSSEEKGMTYGALVAATPVIHAAEGPAFS